MSNEYKKIYLKQIFSEIIDLTICLSAATAITIFTEIKNQFPFLNIILILSFVYLFYGILSSFTGKLQSVGDVYLKIELINNRTGQKTKFLSMIRYLLKFLVIFSLGIMMYRNKINYHQLSLILLIILPIPYNIGGYKYISGLSLVLKAVYRNTKSGVNNTKKSEV